MKTTLIFSFIVFSLFSSVYAQNDTLKEFYPSGKMKKIIPRVNGRKNGIMTEYRVDGTLRSETTYVNDTIDGIEKGYNVKGELYFISSRRKGKIHGITKHYYRNGKLNIETPWADNKQHGVQKWYYENGVLQNEKPYVDDKRHGIAKYYYESGGIYEERPYVNDKENGIVKEYYKDGRLKLEIPYTNGQIDGVVKEYYENGKLKKESSYTNGNLTVNNKKAEEEHKDSPVIHSILSLTKTSKSLKYGFTSEQPVKVGTGSEGGPANQRAYLDLLRDQQGRPIKYERLGSCCDYKSKNAIVGDMAKLDIYKITYLNEKNEEMNTKVYLSFYDYEEPQILFGFQK